MGSSSLKYMRGESVYIIKDGVKLHGFISEIQDIMEDVGMPGEYLTYQIAFDHTESYNSTLAKYPELSSTWFWPEEIFEAKSSPPSPTSAKKETISIPTPTLKSQSEKLPDKTASVTTRKQIIRPRFCRKCGKQLADEVVYCPQCGTKIFLSDEPKRTETPVQSNIHGISSSSSENMPSIPPKPEKPSEPPNPVNEIDSYEDFLKHYAKKG